MKLKIKSFIHVKCINIECAINLTHFFWNFSLFTLFLETFRWIFKQRHCEKMSLTALRSKLRLRNHTKNYVQSIINHHAWLKWFLSDLLRASSKTMPFSVLRPPLISNHCWSVSAWKCVSAWAIHLLFLVVPLRVSIRIHRKPHENVSSFLAIAILIEFCGNDETVNREKRSRHHNTIIHTKLFNSIETLKLSSFYRKLNFNLAANDDRLMIYLKARQRYA